MGKKILKISMVLIILSGIIAAGFYLRLINPDFHMAKTYNVYAYYFYKSQYLNDHGRLPRQDIWSFAPEVFPENVPPLLAYSTVGIYKLIKPFNPDVDFYNLVIFYPVLVYIIWAFSGFWLLFFLFKNYSLGWIFVGLLTVMPLSFSLTGYGRYTEEPLGAFLFFLSLIFLVKFVQTSKALFFWPAILFIAAFFLAWQQFPIFILGLFFVGLIQILITRWNRSRLIFGYSLLVVLPLFLGHSISHNLMDMDYSPISMLREAYLGAKDMGSEFVRTAMYRQDWRNLYLGEFVGLVGLAGWILAGAGFLKSALNLKEPKHLVVFVFSILTLAVAIKFFKSRYLALAPLLLMSSWGIEFFTEKSRREWQKLSNFAHSVYFRANELFFKRSAVIFLIGLAMAGAMFVAYVLFQKEKRGLPLPKTILSSLSENLEIGKEYQIEMKLENGGGDSLQDPASFGGFHVEVENAKVKDIVSWTDRGQSEVIIKPDAQRGNIYWFEAKYASFKFQEFGYLWFKIIPQKMPVNLYYRAWLPAEPTFLHRLKTMVSLSSRYRDWYRHSWRSEEAIQRIPANDDLFQEYCLIKVYAAHEELQNFHCFKKSLE